MLKNFRFWIGLAITAVSIVAVARTVDPNQVAAAMAGMEYGWLIPALVVVIASVWAKAIRWKLLFLPQATPRTNRLFGALMIGYLINTVLPARLGDPARALLVGDSEGVGKAHALSTVVIERLLDVLTLLVLFLLFLPLVTLPDWVYQSAAIVGCGAVLGFGVLLFFSRSRERLLTPLERLLARVPRISAAAVTRQLGLLLSGFDAFSARRNSIEISVWSLIIWIVSAVQIFVVMLAFHLPVPPSAAVMVMVVNAFSMLVPSSPGYIGVFHYVTVVTLAIFGVDANSALSFAIVLHLVSFLPPVALGVAYLWRESLSLGRISARAANL